MVAFAPLRPLALVLALICTTPALRAETVQVPSADAGMNAAIADAQKTLPGFLDCASAALPDGEWLVKWGRAVEGPTEREHIWVLVSALAAGEITGTLANQPEEFDGQAGDVVTFPQAEVSDWMTYDAQGRIEGGYTIRAMLDQLPADQRDALEAQLAPLPQ